MIDDPLFDIPVVLKVKGEKGDKGDRGEKGADGRNGINGRDGIDGRDGLDGRDGKDGKDGKDGRDGVNGIDGRDGKNGKDGLSAYELAVNNGFEGDEKSFLASLKGKDAPVSQWNGNAFTELRELTDIKLNAPSNGQALVYDASARKWINSSVSAGVAWGDITGALSNQTDLQNALDFKYDASNPDGFISGVAWGQITGALSDQTDLQTILDAKVTGASSNTTNAIPVFDGTTGKIIKNSSITHDTATGITTFPENTNASASKSGSSIQIAATNTSATANSDARIGASTAVGGGSPRHTLAAGVTAWSQGVDVSDGQLKKQWSISSFATPYEVVTQSGVITRSLQPDFAAYKSSSSTNATGDSTIVTVVCDTELYDQGGNYNNTTGIFTAPENGKYLFEGFIEFTNIGASHNACVVNLVSSGGIYNLLEMNPTAVRIGGQYFGITFSTAVLMSAGDTAYIRTAVSGSTKTVSIYGQASSPFYTRFSGRKVN